jgi:hypothetical protein
MTATSSAKTIFTNAWPGLRLARHFLAERLLLDLVNEGLDHRQRNIRFQQRHAHFTQGVLDIVLGQAPLAGEDTQALAKTFGKVVEHGNSDTGRPRARSARIDTRAARARIILARFGTPP